MNIYITNFYNIRFFTPNMIPVSTTGGDPEWYHQGTKDQSRCFLDKNNVLNGIREETLSFPFNDDTTPEYQITEKCQKNCPYFGKYPNCQFLSAYRTYLKTIDFDYIVSEFERISRDVKKINNYQEDPIIILIVYEKSDNPCSERVELVKAFEDHGIEVKEWTRDLVDKDCIF